MAQDVAEDVLGAAEDGPSSVSGGKIITKPLACPQLPPTSTPPKKGSSSAASSSSRQGLFECLTPFVGCGRPSDSGGRVVKCEHVKDAANAAFQEAKKSMLRRAATRTRAHTPSPHSRP